jgi:hypothetical protein
MIKQGITIVEPALMSISRNLLKADDILGGYHEVWFFYAPQYDMINVVKVTPSDPLSLRHCVTPPSRREATDYKIPRPLTSQEYKAGQSGLPDKTLFSRAFMQQLFPETLSYMCASVFEKLPDALTTVFTHLDVKVTSPSQKLVNLRPYVNLAAVLSGFYETKQSKYAFTSQFMPWQKVFKDDRAAKPALFLSSRISTQDIAELMDETEKQINDDNILISDSSYFAPLANIAMLGMTLQLIFAEQLAYFSAHVNLPPDETLRLIYKTRASSFFIKGETLDLPVFFDPTCEVQSITIAPNEKLLDKNVLFGHISGIFKGQKIKKGIHLLEKLHSLLDFRDRLLKISGLFHENTRDAILVHAEHLTKQEILLQIPEIFSFDLGEVQSMLTESFYSDVQAIFDYRESYRLRATAQIMPYEIYEVDIPFAGMISEEQIANAEAQTVFPCHSYNFTEEISGTSGLDIACRNVFTLAMIPEMAGKKAFITGIAPDFSYITEYCLINDIPLFYGVRHCGIILDGKKVRLKKDSMELI